MSGLGETLRRERMNRQLALEDISCSTKISTRFLQAIETEDFNSLPGLIFTRNFVRQYANYVGLDPEPLLDKLPRFNLDTAPLPDPPTRKRSSILNSGWSAMIGPAAWTVLAGGVALAAYVHFGSSSHPFDTVRAAVGKATPAVPTREVPGQKASLESPSAAPASPALHAVEVVLEAKEESWVSASADGKSVFVGLLKPGETKKIDAEDRVALRTGNAGGVQVSLNGKALDPLGPSGHPRSVTLTAAGLLIPQTSASVQNPPSGESSPF